MALTTLDKLVNPQVMGDLVDKKLHDLIRFLPLAEVDESLVARPGSTLYLPYFEYIGDASVLGEGSTLTPASLNASMASVAVHKVAQGVQISDEAALSGYGDPMGQGAMQIATAIANCIDNEMLTVLASIGSLMTQEAAASGPILPADVNAALELFGEDIDNGEKVLVCSPALATALRNTKNWLPASEIAADRMIRGAIGEVFGCQVIISNKLKQAQADDEVAYIVKPGALRLILKRDTIIESDRNILDFTNVITGSKHEACYLYDASKAIKLTGNDGA